MNPSVVFAVALFLLAASSALAASAKEEAREAMRRAERAQAQASSAGVLVVLAWALLITICLVQAVPALAVASA